MSTRSDNKQAALVFQTGVVDGHVDDLEVQWLQTLTTSIINDVNDLWNLYWDQLLIPAGNYNDRASAWLTGLGFLQADLSAQWDAYWLSMMAP